MKMFDMRRSHSGIALLLASGALTGMVPATVSADCQSDYDNCERTCTDVNDCPGGCLGCALGCIVAKVICEWDAPVAGNGSFAAFDPAGGHQGAGPIQTFIPGETLVLSAGLYRISHPAFEYDGSIPFVDPADAGVEEVWAMYKVRGGTASEEIWHPVAGVIPPVPGQAPTAQAILPTDQGTTAPYGYSVKFYFQMSDGSLRVADTIVRPACVGDTDFDGFIGFEDLNTVLSQYGSVNNGPQQYLAGDVTRDQVVDFEDLNLVLALWGSECE